MFHIVAHFNGDNYYLTSHFSEKHAEMITKNFQHFYIDAKVSKLDVWHFHPFALKQLKNSIEFTNDYIAKNYLREIEHYYD